MKCNITLFIAVLLTQLAAVAAMSSLARADESTARWNPRTTNWDANPNPAIGDWGFDRPGYPPGLYVQGVTVPDGQTMTNPVIYDNDVFDDVFDDELAMVMASEGEMNLVGLIVTPVLTDGWGFSKPQWIETAHAARRVAEQSGLRMDRIPSITIGTEAESEKAGERKDSAGARLYIRLIHEQFARDPQRPLIVNIGGQGATLASAYTIDPSIADKCVVYYTDLRVYNGHYAWASKLIAKHFRVVSWGDDNWWITKPRQNEWRVLPRPNKAEGKDNDANSGEWSQWTALRVPLLDHMVKQFQTRGEYCQGDRKGDGYLDGTFLHAWLPGIFEDAALQQVRDSEVMHVTLFTERNEDRAKMFANQRLLNPQAYQHQVSHTNAIASVERLRVTDSGRYLTAKDGKTFPWLADTAWELFHRLNREDALYYLDDRAAKGFTVIQAVLLAEFDGLNTPNAYGHRPLLDNDPTKPDVKPGPENDYWDHVDFILDAAAQRGLVVALVPTWGEWVTPRFVDEPIFQTSEQGYRYGHFLGQRWQTNHKLVWILGGDRQPTEKPHAMDVWRAMAEGIADGVNGSSEMDSQADYSTTLMTYHSMSSSSTWWSDEAWLDFHAWGTYHSTNDWPRSFTIGIKDWQIDPRRPTLNAEPCYEEMARDYHGNAGFFNSTEVRQSAYWSLLSGSFGYTYGAHPIWSMWTGAPPPVTVKVPGLAPTRMTWREALDLPAARQMRHIRTWMQARPFGQLRPDQSLLLQSQPADPTKKGQAIRAARGDRFAWIYSPEGEAFEMRTEQLAKGRTRAWWFDPRTGKFTVIGLIEANPSQRFQPPSTGLFDDWMLLVEDEAAAFPDPNLEQSVQSINDSHSYPNWDDGFTSLFNGKDLEGWEGEPGLWKVEDGIVIGTCSGPTSPTHNSFLIWRGGVLKDFELKATVRIIGDNNSGIQYRSRPFPEVGPWAITGYQCDIHPAIEHAGMTYEERGRGIFGLNGMDVVVDKQGDRWLVNHGRDPVTVDVSQWNEYTVIARGNQLIHEINGKITSIMVDHDEKGRALEGLLAIQLHSGNPHSVQVKQIKLRPLTDGKVRGMDEFRLPAGATRMDAPGSNKPQGIGPATPSKQ